MTQRETKLMPLPECTAFQQSHLYQHLPTSRHIDSATSTPPILFGDHPILVVGRLTQTLFSQTLTVLHITSCKGVPLTVFLICPRLREILLNHVEARKESNFPDGQCSGREWPTLDSLDYRNSRSLVEQTITPPPRFHTAVALWSKLRVLTLCLHEKVRIVQPILNIACNTLEELYLTKLPRWGTRDDDFSLTGLVNLRHLSCLHVFAFYATIKCEGQTSGSPRDQPPPQYDTYA